MRKQGLRKVKVTYLFNKWRGRQGEVLNPAKSDSGVQAIDHECKPLPLYSILQELAISFQGQGRFLLVCGGTQTMHSLVLCAVLSCVQLFETLWTVAHQAPLSIGFFMQEYWIGLPFPSPGDLSGPGLELTYPVSPAL